MEIFVDVMNDPQALTKLTDAARTFFGHEFRWVVRAKALLPRSQRITKSRSGARPTPGAPVMEHPVVQQALEILGGELIDIRMSKTDRSEAEKREPASEPGDGPELA